MSEPAVLLAAGCMLQAADVRLDAEPNGWTETLELEVHADPVCPSITVPMAPNTVWRHGRARARYVDGTGQRYTEPHWEHRPATLNGSSEVVLHLPDLFDGDRVTVRVTRSLPPGPRVIQTSAASWSVRSSGETVIDADGQVARHPRRNEVSGTGTEIVTVTAAHHPAAPVVEPLLPPESARLERTVVLDVPTGDPQQRLYPGGGSSQRVEVRWIVEPSQKVSGLLVPSPRGAEIQVEAEPARIASLLTDAGVPRVRVEPFEGRARVRASWTEPDAPTFGARVPGEDELSVVVANGHVVWEGDAWRLLEVHGAPVLPDRARLVAGLDTRFRAVSFPEPGAPAALRGRAPSWELAEALLPELQKRVVMASWPSDPLWPRPLVRARRTGVITPIEAALTLVRWGNQLDFRADWALAYPRTGPATGPIDSPSGYTHPLVRLQLGDEVRWLDPSCEVCAPFELPLALQGARLLSPAETETPPPVPARLSVTHGPDTVTWEATGAAALSVREWLAAVPRDVRSAQLAARMAGPGARLRESEGLADPGAPIRLVAQGTAPPDVLALQDSWVHWVGDIVVTLEDELAGPPLELSNGVLTYLRAGNTESLTVTQRALDDGVRGAIRAARAEALSPPATD